MPHRLVRHAYIREQQRPPGICCFLLWIPYYPIALVCLTGCIGQFQSTAVGLDDWEHWVTSMADPPTITSQCAFFDLRSIVVRRCMCHRSLQVSTSLRRGEPLCAPRNEHKTTAFYFIAPQGLSCRSRISLNMLLRAFAVIPHPRNRYRFPN
ncbi:hypothetical protein HOY80DRAFT_975865 [Tuber brumale]|nr:hypothetical protein HOY80DRAFT_975865 [Tuber brumale]